MIIIRYLLLQIKTAIRFYGYGDASSNYRSINPTVKCLLDSSCLLSVASAATPHQAYWKVLCQLGEHEQCDNVIKANKRTSKRKISASTSHKSPLCSAKTCIILPVAPPLLLCGLLWPHNASWIMQHVSQNKWILCPLWAIVCVKDFKKLAMHAGKLKLHTAYSGHF